MPRLRTVVSICCSPPLRVLPWTILMDLDSQPAYPAEVVDWYEARAREIMRAPSLAEAQHRVASVDTPRSSPPTEQVSG